MKNSATVNSGQIIGQNSAGISKREDLQENIPQWIFIFQVQVSGLRGSGSIGTFMSFGTRL